MLKEILISVALLSASTAMAELGKEKKEKKEQKEKEEKEAPKGELKTLTVKEITCGACVNKIKKSLADVEGVKFFKGNPKEKTVQIEITDAEKYDQEKVLAAIKAGTGWDATVK